MAGQMCFYAFDEEKECDVMVKLYTGLNLKKRALAEFELLKKIEGASF